MQSENIRWLIFILVLAGIRFREKKSGKKVLWSWDVYETKDFEIVSWVSRDAFCHGIHLVESHRDNYKAYNPRTSALGRYQFLPKYFRDDIVRETGVDSHQAFLASPEGQEQFMDHHIRKTLIPGLLKLKKQFKNIRYDDADMLALVHFLWARGAGDFIKNNQMNPDQQVGNISAEKYLQIVRRGMREYG